ncbi:MAG: pilus assembly protein PilM [Lachnospiraceae bacterium]|nr:pilus assembly protein PilM [Lachnospiraceae bacterium]MEE3461870.1 pilus assembly protein PilM [Lachnospiraceae bacterium]
MGKHVLSIEIGEQVTKVAEIDYKKKNPRVYKAITFATPEDIIEDGFIRDRDVLAVAFREQLSNAGIREKSVVFTIASTKIVSREVTIPNVKPNKIQGLLEATAQDYFPIDLSAYTLAHSVLEETADEKGAKALKVLLLAAPDSLITNYYNFASDMGWSIASIDYFGNGSIQVLKREIVLDYSACIQISGNSSVVTFLNKGQQLMQRTIPYGVFSIAQAIVNNEISSISDFDTACETMTRDRLLCRTLDYEGLDDSDTARMTDNDIQRQADIRAARKVATDAVGDIIMSVVRIFDFFHSQYPEAQLTGLYITGMGVQVKGIDDLFASEIDVPIHRMDNLVSVSFPRNFGNSLYNQTEYIAVIGAAMDPVGFKSKDKSVRSSTTSDDITAYVVAGCALFAIGLGLILFSVITYMSAKKTNADLTARKQSLSYIEEIYNENQQVNNIDTKINELNNNTKNNNENLNQIIQLLEQVLPSDTHVESFTSDGNIVSLNLKSGQDISVARLIMDLEKIPALTEVKVEAISGGNIDDKSSGNNSENITGWSYSCEATLLDPISREALAASGTAVYGDGVSEDSTSDTVDDTAE